MACFRTRHPKRHWFRFGDRHRFPIILGYNPRLWGDRPPLAIRASSVLDFPSPPPPRITYRCRYVRLWAGAGAGYRNIERKSWNDSGFPARRAKGRSRRIGHGRFVRQGRMKMPRWTKRYRERLRGSLHQNQEGFDGPFQPAEPLCLLVVKLGDRIPDPIAAECTAGFRCAPEKVYAISTQSRMTKKRDSTGWIATR